MSIADKITSIENHLKADYDSIEKLIDVNVDKNIENIASLVDSIYDKFPKVTGEGTEVTLTPTLKGKLGIVEKGNSTQESTTGKNLYPTGTKFTPTQVIWVDNYGNDISSVAQILSNENYLDLIGGQAYTFKINEYANIKAIQVVYLDNSTIKTFVNVANDTLAHTFTPATNTRIWVRYSVNTANQETYIIAQLEKGSSATTYEQYTGGIPSPNPTFPSPIKSVTGNNNVVIQNKNLFSLKGFLTDRNVPYTENQDGSITFNTSGYAIMYGNPFVFSDTNTRVSLSGEITNGTSTNFRIELLNESNTVVTSLYSGDSKKENANVCKLRFNWSTSGTVTVENIQLELGPTATSYEEHKVQTLPLNLGNIELNGIGTYKNLIFKAENGNPYYDSLTSEQKALLTYGARYYHEEIGKVVLNGSENFWGFTANCCYSDVILNTVKKPANNNTKADILCNHYIVDTLANCYNNVTDKRISVNNGGYLYIYDTSFTSANAIKTWLATHNITCVFALATATDIEITDTNLISQLEEIDKMQSYNGTTIITSTYDSNNAQMILSASALKGE